MNDVMHENNLNYMETIGYEMDYDLLSRVNPDNNITIMLQNYCVNHQNTEWSA